MPLPRRFLGSTSPGERGAITWVTIVGLAALATAGYLAVVWVPVGLVHYEAKQVARDYANQAVKNPDDAVLVERMCQKLRVLDSMESPGPDGRLEKHPTVEVQPGEVTWERDASAVPPTLHVAFEYRRDIHFPLLDRWTERIMRVDITEDISRPDWGPAR
jgi:hypothetical protein